MADVAGALAKIDEFEAIGPPVVAWQLDRATTIERIRTLVRHPELLNQRSLNACGPAVFFRIWFARDPVAAAVFSCAMLRDGFASIGSKLVQPRPGLLAQNYAALRATADAAQLHSMPDTADWMLLSALRDSENLLIPYLGEPHTLGDRAAGVTLPMTLTGWLTATALYQPVENATTVLPGVDNNRLVTLIPTSNVDAVLLINSTFNANLFPTLASRPATPPVMAGIHLPDHYVLVTAPCQLDMAMWLNVEFWTWGRTISGWVGTSDFGSRYFGMIVATV